ncbi:TPA: hypothetical protein ACJHE6_000106 [Clostridioides difficile]|nr:DNA cytosine methyltransferase [Clostridioides difficile]
MKVKYVVFEWEITSKNDGQKHFINFRDLIKLYRVSLRECIRAKLSNTQLYKQAGNSICVPVLEEIFKKLLQEYIYN